MHTKHPYSSTARLGDKTLMSATVVACMAAVALSATVANGTLGYQISGGLLLVAGLMYALFRGTKVTRYGLTTVLVSLVALHIHLAQGQLEYHFGVFIVLAFLMVYLDWKLIVFGAVLFAAHHIAFDRLQAAGFGLWCTDKADFLRIVLHAVYVVIQTAVEVVIVIRMRALVRQGVQLAALVNTVNSSRGIALDTAGVQTDTPDAQQLQACLNRMNVVVQTVRTGAFALEIAATEIAIGNHDLSQRTEHTTQSLHNAADNMGTLISTISTSAQSAAQANTVAKQTREIAITGGHEVDSVVATMQEISQSSRRISEIISVIDGIAFQTNILALNAAVEAARAGEHGRGFAVVATEVRALAGRSANAAKEIKTLIDASVHSVEAGTHLVSQAGSTMRTVVQSIAEVTDIISSLADASSAQASDIAALGQTISGMEQATQDNATLVERLATSTKSLQSQAQSLVETTTEFI